MKKRDSSKWLAEMVNISQKGDPVRVDRRPVAEDCDDGFVFKANEKFVLLNVYTPEFYINGYSVIRTSDIDRYRKMDDDRNFVSKVLKLKGIKPEPIDVSLNSYKDVFLSLTELFPLVTIHREMMSSETCNVGRIEKVTDKTVVIQEIDSSGQWDKSHRFNFDDITRIDFGGGYENALALVEAHEQKKEKKVPGA